MRPKPMLEFEASHQTNLKVVLGAEMKPVVLVLLDMLNDLVEGKDLLTYGVGTADGAELALFLVGRESRLLLLVLTP